MTSSERLCLKHVLQSVCTLESVILRSFGPGGGQVLFTRDTGQAMLSRSGTQILTALHLEHPLARMVVDCVWKHCRATGDGSKSFVLLLASFLRIIHATVQKERLSQSYNATEAATARHLADKLLAFALTELDCLIAVNVVPYGLCLSSEGFPAKPDFPAHQNIPHVQSLLSSFFHTRLGNVHSEYTSGLALDMLSHWKFKHDQLLLFLQFLNDNFAALHTPVVGFPVNSSRLIEGQIIHRDFATPCPRGTSQPVNALIFTGYIQQKLLCPGDVLSLDSGGQNTEGRNILDFSIRTEESLERVIGTLQSLDVSVLLCSKKQSDAVLALATQAKICIVECVSMEELSLCSRLSGVMPASDCRRIRPENIATLAFCKPVSVGAHRYAHVGFSNSEDSLKPCSLLLCAPGEGQAEQYARALLDSFRMLHATFDADGSRVVLSHKCPSLHMGNPPHEAESRSSSLHVLLEPGCVLPAGGTFEFLLHSALAQHSKVCSNSDAAISQILANTLLRVPHQIYAHKPKQFLLTQNRIVNFVLRQSHSFHVSSSTTKTPLEDYKPNMDCFRKGDAPSELFMLDLGLESVSCKHQLLLAVMQCLASLLRVNMLLQTQTALGTKPKQTTNISWKSTESSDED